MGIIDKIFGRKQAEELPPNAGVGYGDFVTPKGKVPIIPSSGKGTGPDGWAPKLGYNLPTIPDQDRLLIHYDKEGPSDPGQPSQFWAGQPNDVTGGRNWDRIRRGKVEKPTSSGDGGGPDSWQVESTTNKEADDPKRTPVPNSRPTQSMSASNYRFYAPMRGDHGDIPHLNGTHFSMATNRRTYPIRGMRPAQHFRNTFRLEPPPRDAQSMDLSSNQPQVPDREYISPAVPAPTARGSFRL